MFAHRRLPTARDQPACIGENMVRQPTRGLSIATATQHFICHYRRRLAQDGRCERRDMEVEGDERARLPIHMLASVVCFGRVMISPPLLGYCTEEGVSVAYLSMHGRFLARVEGPVTGNVLLRRDTYSVSDDLARAEPIVRIVVAGKIYNQRA